MLIGATIDAIGEAAPIGAKGGGAIEIAGPAGVVSAGRYWEGGGTIEIAGPAGGVFVGGYWESGGAIEIAAPIGVVGVGGYWESDGVIGIAVSAGVTGGYWGVAVQWRLRRQPVWQWLLGGPE